MAEEPSAENGSRDDILEKLNVIKNAPPGSGKKSSSFPREHLDHEDDEVRGKAHGTE